jgi:hypothetical protein
MDGVKQQDSTPQNERDRKLLEILKKDRTMAQIGITL